MELRPPVAVLVAGLLTLAACTSTPSPDQSVPSPSVAARSPVPPGDEGLAVGVVLGAPTSVPAAELAAQRVAAEALGELDGVASVRTVTARDGSFLVSLALLLADDGLDVVCLAGTGTGRALAEAARQRPGQRFCGTDPTLLRPPENVAVVGLDHGELAQLAGAALGPADGAVALLTTPETGGQEAFVASLEEGLPRPPPPPPPPAGVDATPPPVPSRTVLAVEPAGVEDVARDEVDALLGRNPVGVVALTARHDAAAATEAQQQGVPVVGVADWLAPASGAALPDSVLLAFVVDRRDVLAAALLAAVGPGLGERTLVGAQDGDVLPAPGRLPGSTGALARVEQAVAAAGADTTQE